MKITFERALEVLEAMGYELEQAEQEPVGIYYGEAEGVGHRVRLDVELPIGTKLYAAPVQQAEQEPEVWMQKGTIEWIKQPRNERNQTQVIVTGVNVFDGQIPLYARPVRTKDLTDDEIGSIYEKHHALGGCWTDGFAYERAVIAADREKNK